MGSSSEEQQQYLLRWNDYTDNFVAVFQSLRDKNDFVDVTVACDGHHYSAHKMVLSAYSTFFHSLLIANPCPHPIIILKDVGHTEIERLLEFMYNGEVNIVQDQLAAFLKTAEILKIKGLTEQSDDFNQNEKKISRNYSSCLNARKKTHGIFKHKLKSTIVNSNTAKRRKVDSSDSVTSKFDISCEKTGKLVNESHVGNNIDEVNINEILSLNVREESARRELKLEPSDEPENDYNESSEKLLAEPVDHHKRVCVESSAVDQHSEESSIAAFLLEQNILGESQKIELCHRCGSIMKLKRKRDRGGEFQPILRCPKNGCQTTRSLKKVYNK